MLGLEGWEGLEELGGIQMVEPMEPWLAKNKFDLDFHLETGNVVVSAKPSTIQSHTTLRFEVWHPCRCGGPSPSC